MERHFSAFLQRIAGTPQNNELSDATRLLTRQMSQGHICLDLEEYAGTNALLTDGKVMVYPHAEPWVQSLRKSPVVGEPGQWRPLILDPPLLYLQRYWQYEKDVTDFILRRCSAQSQIHDIEKFEKNLNLLFPSLNGERAFPDYQKEAARKALFNRFCVISGGPGTGKTTTVARILALYREIHGTDNQKQPIILAAPTGKAAARLQEAVREAKKGLACSAEIKNAIPETAVTIHRLLGCAGQMRRYHSANLLSAALVVVDEASMVDLPLMAWLMTSLPAECGLILLGDRNQLASVQPGAVLGDICQGLREAGRLASFVELEKSYRFDEKSGIGSLSTAVKEGNGANAMAILHNSRYSDVRWQDVGENPRDFQASISKSIASYHKRIRLAESAEKALQLMKEFAVLGAVRHGHYGVEAVNSIAVENIVSIENSFFHGQPIMVTENDYSLQLFNGDTGLILRDPAADNELRAFFPSEKGLRKLLPARLPRHDNAFAYTVHKSQGSEFRHVLLVLPRESSPVLCRELIYTAITRAAESIEIQGAECVFREAVEQRTSRKSGLVRALARASRTQSPAWQM